MTTIKEHIQEICKNTKVSDVSSSMATIQEYLKNELIKRLDNVEMNEVQRTIAHAMCEYWSYPICWRFELKPVLYETHNDSCISPGISLALNVENLDDIDKGIDSYVENVKKLLTFGGLFRLPPMAMVEQLQRYIRDIRKNRELSPKNSESRIHELLDDFFGMKVLDYSPNQNLEQYFDFPESYVSTSKTTIPAIVQDSKEGEKGILKGTYVCSNNDSSL